MRKHLQLLDDLTAQHARPDLQRINGPCYFDFIRTDRTRSHRLKKNRLGQNASM